MPQKSQDPTLKAYKANVSAYKNYGGKLSNLKEEEYSLKQQEKSLGSSFVSILAHIILFFGVSYFSVFVISEQILSKLNSELGTIGAVLSLYGSMFFVAYASDFIINLVSFGKLNKLKKTSDQIQEQIKATEELKTNAYNKLKPFEEATSHHYQAELNQFFVTNLYQKRSGNQQFEESLSEFASMIKEISAINSSFVTKTHIPLEGHIKYLVKRKADHGFQNSKENEELVSARKPYTESNTTPIPPPSLVLDPRDHRFVKNVFEPQEQKRQETIAPERLYRTARKIDNWEEINRKRKMTGLQGEEIAVALEQEFFESIGRKDLADKVRHVSAEYGDGLGYDVLSFFEDGREKYIEVKSTTTALKSPFYLSRNELGFLKDHNEDTFLYRVLISGDVPQIMIFTSREILEMNEIIPVQYMVRVK
ncbi:MAG: hypothetical protein A3F82_04075 [Deltaproteobacteria bacterium RIFCSPLOWO2_12_FULL_44_12]|nr:MAG: hypothetical protein A2712_08385 [Deltaproteobacteria bacterium RIFCSPHIGHO2_01_FULL_43_49]OGQ14645.1 MAG: hypothetical protein A3D22_08615 [Deltaproteobacteria bacterium RIFCSPHIGHO2_02_FULL_44_53]OGQ28031.1 MAG: hypothetical protein A3D98_07325 [Deltaproteobacteria bacterium RIFCSPHIGHO2_12_FULL_44_21]OGQ31243.1 MAG: hypothetical protein A2979_07375 [Deltaproteobacteria bacterium RIFCSPLOWO2_01_FULL_45_74]OGQ43235.1 MAG: hypothetical protein A3I70_01035 [Deltaproteobacteria bacterium 